jgi:hypothetical protein
MTNVNELRQRLARWKWEKNEFGQWEKVNLDFDELMKETKSIKQKETEEKLALEKRREINRKENAEFDKEYEADKNRGPSHWENYDNMIEDGFSHDEALASSGLSPDIVRAEADNPEQLWEYGVATPSDLEKNPKHKGYKKTYRGLKSVVDKKGNISQVKPPHSTQLVEKPPVDNPNEVKDSRFDEKGNYIKKRRRPEGGNPDDPDYRTGKLRQRLARIYES